MIAKQRVRHEYRQRALVLLSAMMLCGCYTGLNPSGSGDGADDAASNGDGLDAGSDGSGGSDTGEGEDVDDPGRITLHRLNRAEYNNTIRDLFWGLDVSPADNFPADDHSYGFDNIADVLSVTPLLFELYERGTEDVIELALTSTGGGETQHAEAEDGTGTAGAANGSVWVLSSAGAVTNTFEVETDGDYTLRVRAYGQQAGPDLPLLQIEVDGVAQGAAIPVDAVEATPGTYEIDAPLVAGTRSISARFTNDFYDADAGADRNLYIDWIEIEGQGAIDPGASDVRAKLLTCSDPQPGEEAACTREVLAPFVERAWRRPVAAGELDALVDLAESARQDGDSWEDALKHALKGVLLSPNFIFRVELDDAPDDLTAHPVSDWELASRLSYFLWSSMPDDELFAAARDGSLSDPDVLRSHATRMLADERAQALVANFAGQWLYGRAVQPGIVKDATLYPTYDAALVASMRTEMDMFFATFVTERRSLRELLTADTTFVDANLAALYGLPAPEGGGFEEVSLEGANRRGMMSMAGLMTVLSHPDTSSPVKRGKWVLEQLLCTPPSPPPPGADTDPPAFDPDASVREQLEAHRADPKCAACHNLIDPLGLGLEHYDAIGAYRMTDGGKPVDASGNLPDGTAFADGLEMVELLSERDDFARCTIKHTFTYALGRGTTLEDDPYLDEIFMEADAAGFTLEDLVFAIIGSDTFRMRRGEEVSP